ncbi:hypothetical protein HMPREF9999_02061 [Alloprevotella sp. oral taxon 473 str. F0040]|nr:hypothetical protein HMPREF9999_02061 [Alloprevotella sp. oral taxon 473 str. F0040]
MSIFHSFKADFLTFGALLPISIEGVQLMKHANHCLSQHLPCTPHP